jgi:hypothetical protein
MAMVTRVRVAIVKIVGWPVISEWGGHLAKSCPRRKQTRKYWSLEKDAPVRAPSSGGGAETRASSFAVGIDAILQTKATLVRVHQHGRDGHDGVKRKIAVRGILPRHACSARCGARRRSETWPLRSAPCRPRQSARFLPRANQVAQGRNSPRAQACGFVDNAKTRCPQTHRPNSSRRQSE